MAADSSLGASTPALAAAELAYHWSEAGDRAAAAPAYRVAARTAEMAFAWAEAWQALERVIELEDATDGPASPAIDRAELRLQAAWLANFAGDSRRGLSLARAAVEVDDEIDPIRSGLLLDRVARLANDGGDWELMNDASERAIELIPADPPSEARASAVAGIAAVRMIQGRGREAVALARAAVELSQRVDARVAETEAYSVLSVTLAYLGWRDGSRAALAEVVPRYDEMTRVNPFVAGMVLTNSPFAMFLNADFAAARTHVDEAVVRTAALDIEQAWVPWLEPTAAEVDYLTGRWIEAGARLDRIPAGDLVGHPWWGVLLCRAMLAAGRGDRAAVESIRLPATDADAGYPLSYYRGLLEWVGANAALWDRDPVRAAQEVDAALEEVLRQEDVIMISRVLATAARAHADLAERARAGRREDATAVAGRRTTEIASIASAIAAGTYLEGTGSTPWIRALAALMAGEASRASGGERPVSVACRGRSARRTRMSP